MTEEKDVVMILRLQEVIKELGFDCLCQAYQTNPDCLLHYFKGVSNPVKEAIHNNYNIGEAIKILEESEVKMALTNEQRDAKMDDKREHGIALQVLKEALPGDICAADQESIMKSIKDLEELSLPDNIIISKTYYQTLGKQQSKLIDGFNDLKKAIKTILEIEV